MTVPLSIEWVSWAAECVALNVETEVITTTMTREGMDAAEVQKLLQEIAKLPGYTALARMANKYKEAHAQVVALTQAANNAVRVIPKVALNGKSILVVDGHSITVQAVFETPNIVVFSNFLTPEECQVLVKASAPKLQPSMGIEHKTGGSVLTPARTSYGTSFQRGETEIIARIEQRISKVLNCPISHGEGLQVLRYAVGQQYIPHYDYFVDAAKATRVGGQRVGTLLMYLNTPEAGGTTTFPNIGLEVQPVAGNAVFFSYPEDTDVSTLHGGNPVIAGEKWVATKWLRAINV